MNNVNDNASYAPAQDSPSAMAVSALMDGELSMAQVASVVEGSHASTQTLEQWKTYHLIGESLRAHVSDVRTIVPPTFIVQNAQPAANDPVWRWKLAASVAGLAAVGALAWTMVSSSGSLGPVLAQNSPVIAPQPANGNPNTHASANANANTSAETTPNATMIRDQRLDELLAAHKQFGGASALQQPAGFLRNANFSTSGR
jgi:sigma-E factor negative regulatory protein RseA